MARDPFAKQHTVTVGDVRLPVAPADLPTEAAATMLPLRTIALGSVPVPRGREARQWSWEGMFPGQSMAGQRWVRAWTSPMGAAHALVAYAEGGMMVTYAHSHTGEHSDAYVESVRFSPPDGFGTVRYRIGLVEARKITVGGAPGSHRTAVATESNSTTRKGETAADVAHRTLGNDAHGAAVREANPHVDWNNPNGVTGGQSIHVPSKTPGPSR